MHGIFLVDGFGGNGTRRGAEGEPFGGAQNSMQGTSPFGRGHGGVTLLGQGVVFGLLVVEVALDSGELGLAGFAVHGEVIERLQIGCGEDGVRRLVLS